MPFLYCCNFQQANICKSVAWQQFNNPMSLTQQLLAEDHDPQEVSAFTRGIGIATKHHYEAGLEDPQTWSGSWEGL